MESDRRIAYFARTNHRNGNLPVGIRTADRRSHMYVVGKTGTGKSTLLKTLLLQDINAGAGCALLDPHGDLAEELRALAPPSRLADFVYIDVPGPASGFRFNPFADVPVAKRSLCAENTVEVFKKLWPNEWGPRLEHLLRNVVWALLENEGSTFADIPRLLLDRDFRNAAIKNITNEVVREFWTREFTGYSPAFRAVVTAPLLNKVGGFLSDPILRSVLTAPRSSLDFRTAIDSGKVLVVNLAKGKLGEGPSSLVGSLLVSHLSLKALERADQPPDSRRDFFLYLDEFHTFATLSLATMLSELRKYRLNLILAHQYLSQLEPEIRDAVFGNVGTFVSFRVGAIDAPVVARELEPTFEPEDLITLPNFSVYLRLMIDGEPSRAFSATSRSPKYGAPSRSSASPNGKQAH